MSERTEKRERGNFDRSACFFSGVEMVRPQKEDKFHMRTGGSLPHLDHWL